MTAYEYDNLPDTMEMVDALPEDLFSTGLAIVSHAVATGQTLAKEAKVAHAYDRKGYMELDTLGGHRNPSYGAAGDDLILQVTIRVWHPSNTRGTLDALQGLENLVVERNAEAERLRLEQELSLAEDVAAKAAAAVVRKREELERSKGKGK